MRWTLIFALLPQFLFASPTAVSDLARSVREAGLDPDECYRVRDLSLIRDDLRFYFTDGYVIFAKAVNGVRSAAIFTADADGGDAELLVLPPQRSERMSLATYTGSPNMDEHFTAAALIFADKTYATLSDQIRDRGAKKSPDMGRLLTEKWNGVMRNLIASVQIRLVEDLLAAPSRAEGLFYGALTGKELGNFDVIYDPDLPEQIAIGQVVYRDSQPYYNIWTNFAAAPYRKGTRPKPGLEFRVSDFRLDATLEPDLNLRVTTRVAVTPAMANQRVLPFEISRAIRVTGASVNGEPAEVFQPESLRANLVRGSNNMVFLLAPSQPLEAGRTYEVEFKQEGNVITDAGNHVFYVGARVDWYPNRALQFARYDLTFHYPRTLDLVATGQVTENRTDGEWQLTRRRTETPVRIAAFNLGEYQRVDIARAGFRVEVCANRKVEFALQSKPQAILIPPRRTPFPGINRKEPEIYETTPIRAIPDPGSRLKQIGTEIVSCLEFMTGYFGPPPLRTITVAPIPGTFGQGFAGMVYLSTMAYLDPAARPISNNDHERFQQTFYSEIMHAHEIAHQWWGNVVTTYEHRDEWLMEALANYSALLYLEKRKGPRSVESVLDEYKTQLLSKSSEGKTIESTGPITWGIRLNNSQTPGAWATIIYAKGSWIMHMLRRRMGDKQFLAMLGDLRRRYEYKAISTEEFREFAVKYMPPQSPDAKLENFFDEWVYGIGVPTMKLKYSVTGKAPAVKLSGTVTQTEVDPGFSVPVPIEIQLGKAKPVTHWVLTGPEPVTFTVNLRQAPTKVALDPSGTVLAVRK